jgi:hypothetical protein
MSFLVISLEKVRPRLVKEVEDALEVVAGGIHRVVLEQEGGGLDIQTNIGCHHTGGLHREAGGGGA